MHFFDASRPKINGLPVFLPEGKARGVLPSLTISFFSENLVEIAGFFCKTPTIASRLSGTIPLADLSEFLSCWLEDPEGMADKFFHYKIEEERVKGSPAPTRPALTLADLGL